MSRTRKKRSLPRRTHGVIPADEMSALDMLLSGFLGMGVAALPAARLLVPTESAAAGDTLWLVQLWLGLGVIWAWWSYRAGKVSPQIDRWDVAVGILVGGHVLAALVVVATSGDKRAAVNSLWEWVGLGTLFFLVRRVVVNDSLRRTLVIGFTSLTIALSVLGLWQHYVWYAETVEHYTGLREELDELTADGRAMSARQVARVQSIQRDFGRQGIPLEGTSRALWENRLRASSEPIGFFALANSFAAVLLVWLLVGLGIFPARDAGRWERCLWLVGLMLPAFCLVLTKSRTAWGGFFVGAAVLLYQRYRRSGKSSVSFRRIASGILFIAAMLVVAGLSGGFDWAVVSESTKSLQYRWEYWVGTFHMIADQPWVGTGPGNFRQDYLAYKLPGSSEEIADPHNLILDVWANAGVIGLAGLMTLFSLLIFRSRDSESADESERGGGRTRFSHNGGNIDWTVLLGVAAGFGVVGVYDLLFNFVVDGRLWMIFGVWVGVTVCLVRVEVDMRFLRAAFTAAIVGLAVHLLGAGGIGMPGICQLLLIPMALFSGSGRTQLQKRPTERPWRVVSIGVAFTALFVGCLLSATGPVVNRTAFARIAEADWENIHRDGGAGYRSGRLDSVFASFQAATDADPLSAEPWMHVAELRFLLWTNGGLEANGEFEKVVEAAEQAALRNPKSFLVYRQMGRWYLARYRRQGQDRDIERAIALFRRAGELYPNNAGLRGELAEALYLGKHRSAAGDEARVALELDAINRAAGHSDKFLSEEILSRLKEIEAPVENSQSPTDAN